MEYQDIPEELKIYIPKEELYNIIDDDMKNLVLDGARLKWEKEGSAPIGSIVNLHRIGSQETNYPQLLDIMYNCMTIHSTVGIIDHRYDMTASDSINNYDFIRIVQEAHQRVHTTNVTLTFVLLENRDQKYGYYLMNRGLLQHQL